MPRAGAARELREGLDRGGGLGGGGVAAAQHLDDGARGLVTLEGGARGLEGGLLALEPLGEGVELASAVDALQRGDGGVRCGPCGLFGAPRPLGGRGGLVGPRGHGGEVLLGEFGQRREPQPGRMLLECRDLLVLEGSGLGEAGERRPEGLPGGIDLTPRLLAHLLELLLHAVVDLGAEHALQHGLALGGAGAQEAGELVLRQQHRLRELLAGQPDGALDLAAHLVDAGGDHVEAAAAAGGVGDDVLDQLRGADPPQHRLGLLLGGAGAAQLGALVLRGAAHPVDAGGGLEDQVHHARLGRRRELGADPVRAGGAAGDLPVQRVHERVEDGGLAGAGGALEQEHAARAERGEVDLDSAGEGADPRHPQVVELHEASRCPRAAV